MQNLNEIKNQWSISSSQKNRPLHATRSYYHSYLPTSCTLLQPSLHKVFRLSNHSWLTCSGSTGLRAQTDMCQKLTQLTAIWLLNIFYKYCVQLNGLNCHNHCNVFMIATCNSVCNL